MNRFAISVKDFVAKRNREKLLFTAGPASLLAENILGLRPCFGREDGDYDAVEASVLGALKAITGHPEIVRLQGSASLALEIAGLNFLQGKVLVVQSGFYSKRLADLVSFAQLSVGAIRQVEQCDWQKIEEVSGAYDWIVSCYAETSRGLLVSIRALEALKKNTGAKILLDATASIGLEQGHEAADVICYSSCKGLFGLTGAGFIAYSTPPQIAVPSFYLDLATHAEKKTTGPYHAIASLLEVLPRHAEFAWAVSENKRRFMRDHVDRLRISPDAQPQLCTWVDGRISSDNPAAVLYRPRDLPGGSIVCHLGEAHLGLKAQGDILKGLEFLDE
ncbi:hypothetical protein [Pseudolabrys sp.]|uniref:hypothetical protein n=1 Tax=Pseudolabrys sp. TaxID=1960880 RepID=UPI003D10363D